MSRLARSFVVLVAAIALTAVAGPLAGSALGATTCSTVASPQGSDSASGTLGAPVQTAQRLADITRAGQVGCLRGGAYSGGIRFNHGGSQGSPLVLQSYPGERARIVGRIQVPQGSNDVTVTNLDLDGVNSGALPSPTINGDRATFTGDIVTNDHTTICFNLGNEQYGEANDTVISDNEIHDCGRLPSTNHDHGIYVAVATRTTIEGNYIHDNADRGVQLYPTAQYTTIRNNVIVHNGEGIIFSGDGGTASNNNVVENNIVADSTIRHDIESYYPPGNPLGQNNVARNNCVSSSGVDTSSGGFAATNNIVARAGDIVAVDGSYRIAASSTCASVVPMLTQAAASAPVTTTPAPTPPPTTTPTPTPPPTPTPTPTPTTTPTPTPPPTTTPTTTPTPTPTPTPTTTPTPTPPPTTTPTPTPPVTKPPTSKHTKRTSDRRTTSRTRSLTLRYSRTKLRWEAKAATGAQARPTHRKSAVRRSTKHTTTRKARR